MKTPKILITGASGCVGQYTAHWLLENTNAELFLLLRDPNKLTSINKTNPRVKLLIGDLREAEIFSDSLSEINHVIHTATAWGDPQRAKEVNIIAVKKLLSLLDHKNIEKILYFSTASVLNKKLEPLPEAKFLGTEYIQTKAICLEQLENHELAKKIIAIFPTLVFGGKCNGNGKFPTSYLTEGLKEVSRWLWLARWFHLNSTFHFIHAADIAYICGKIVTQEKLPIIQNDSKGLQKIVLGQAPISINQAIKELLKWNGLRRTPSLPLWGWLIQVLIKILPIQITDWDLFSIKQRHFIHEPVTSPESIGGNSYAKNLNEILFESGLPRLKKSFRR